LTGLTRSNDLYAWTAHYNINRPYGTNAYSYTSENRLATGPRGASLTYDPTGRLSKITQGAATTKFDYLGPRLVIERNAAGTILRRYVHGPGDDEPVIWYEGAGIAASARRFLHTDERGSVIAVSNNAGTSLVTIKYDGANGVAEQQYGIPQSTAALTPAASGRFLYTGQAFIPELGLYYYRARFTAPCSGGLCKPIRLVTKTALTGMPM
jgi:hypothetical protein